MTKIPPKVIVITGATGSGKSTVAKYLQEHYHLPQVVTHTTRPKRDKEIEGLSYYFENKDSFQQKHYLEQVDYAGNQYGSSYEGLENAWQKSPLISIVLDSKGAETYYQQLGDTAVILFMAVSNKTILKDRLTLRGDKSEFIQQRLSSDEFERDLQLPDSLKNHAIIIENDSWYETKSKINAVITDLLKGRMVK